ncbi:TadE/TadG family type IV pilus assembly protein [Streptomyces triticagri]|uniref:TadE/TadG family type IV pilus assembly protein n=1 Tax=Streptomyces triticagri TaxID=2293568 RepID=UPI001F4141F9|nr:TadE/TadG family type IV pilus assembly protein [Streptomyces triticagri]
MAAGISRDRGAATTELVLAAPLLILLTLVAVGFGKLAGARLDADEAAHQAARAATLARTTGEAGSDAGRAARQSLAGAGSSCSDPRVAPEVGDLAPGGVVRVTVRCHVALDVPGLGDVDVEASASSVVDRYRGEQL